MRFQYQSKRNTINNLRPLEVAAHDDIAMVDWFLDHGGSEPVRGLPDNLTGEIVNKTRELIAKTANTPLRCAELAISLVYQAHKYTPSWNSFALPERDIIALI